MADPYLNFIHPDDRAATQAEADKINAGKTVISFENRYRCKDGSYRWLLWKATPVLEEQLVYAAARDITDRKGAEARLESLNAELEATNKELETFTYSVSHDLRAPLRHMSGFSRILLEDHAPQLTPDAQHCVSRIQQGVEQMGQLVDDLLNLSRISRQEVRRQITGLTPLVEQTVRQLSAELQGRQVEWRVQPLPFADCDPALMKQVFANLLSNAVKFTRTRSPAVIEVGADTRNGEPVLFVRDNGVGFPMKYAGKLFGVFQRLHRQEDFEGTGVGLAIVHRILTKHGGRIWGEGELDKGATFFFTLGATDSLESSAKENPACSSAK
jgi:light-regulated signal transduction histidine kinase (bacteriophytochrome)